MKVAVREKLSEGREKTCYFFFDSKLYIGVTVS